MKSYCVAMAALLCLADTRAEVINAAQRGGTVGRANLPLPPQASTTEISRARVFPESLRPSRPPSQAENRALWSAITTFVARTNRDEVAPLTTFLERLPGSAWEASLRTELGCEYFRTGWYSKALENWEQVWRGRTNVGSSPAQFSAARAGSHLAGLYARLGRMTALYELLPQLEPLALNGADAERVRAAKDGLWSMEHAPEISFRCGSLALDRIRSNRSPTNAFHSLILGSKSTTNGISLAEVAELSAGLGMNYQMAFRAPGAELIVPAVVHWKVGHYAALIRVRNGLCLTQDPTFGDDAWISRPALDHEGSGYALIPPGLLPPGWRSVSQAEGRTVFGKGSTSSSNPDATTPYDTTAKGQDPDRSAWEEPNSCGMASWDAHLMLVSQEIFDTPTGYRPPFGPPVFTTLRFTQRQNERYGERSHWSHNWQGMLYDDVLNNFDSVWIKVDGGWLTFVPDENDTNVLHCKVRSPGVLIRASATNYVWRFPDGTKRIYSTSSLTNSGTLRYVSFTGVEDAAGNRVSIGLGNSSRVETVTDPLGQVTRFFYELPDPGEPEPLPNSLTGGSDYAGMVTRIVDPFGRTAQFQYVKVLRSFLTYCQSGTCPVYYYGHNLTNVVDAVGLSSKFSYASSGGSDYVSSLTTPYGTTTFEWSAPRPRNAVMQITDPQGDKERIEYTEDALVNVPFAEAFGAVPQGMPTWNRFLYARNSYHWDKHAYAKGFATNDYSKARIYHFTHDSSITAASGILESFKLPLENRVWFNYPGQALSTVPGTGDQPSRIGRMLDDGTTQLQQFERNSLGNVTRSIDPVGRTLSFIYATNEVDLLEVRQTRAGNNELLAQMTYDARHLPLSTRDAAGQTTRFSYNGRGQLLSVTNAKNEVVSFNYDANGYLLASDGPLPGLQSRSTYSYDTAGRLRTATDQDGYTVTLDYDAMDRLTRTTYPNGTFTEVTYDRLKPGSFRDRLGRQSFYTYNNLQQIAAVQDALGRVTRFDWCNCGDLESIIDPLGQMTRWRHDVQGRITGKDYAGGSQVSYAYESTTSRLKSVRDEQGQITVFKYNADDTLREKSYLNALKPTPTVSFTHDAHYRRLASMQDGNGTTAFSYQSVLAPGAGRMAAIDGPWANDTITFAYDQLGRVSSRAINGAAIRRTFDLAGRLTQLTNFLGAFDLTWESGSARLSGVHYPNGQATEYAYHPNSRDQLLQRVTHRLPNNAILSEFTYLYNPVVQMTNWTQFQNGIAKTWVPTYDAGERLQGVAVSQGGVPAQPFNYAYDNSDNRTVEQASGVARNFAYDALNQLAAISDSPVPAVAYEWDAEHRLVGITNGTHRTEFSYDGLDRRTGVVEKENGVIVTDRRYLWSGLQLIEERDATGGATLKRFSTFGMASLAGSDLPAGNYYFTRDHLASVREMCDQSGNIRARFDFGPYGDRQRLSGDLEPGFGFTGHPLHVPSSLHLAPFRAYDARLARWISRDPAGEAHGPNLYAYVSADPVNLLDPLGQAGTRADGLVQNTSGYKQAQAGISAFENGKTALKTLDSIADDGVKAVAKGKIQDLGKDAVDKIVQKPHEEVTQLVNEAGKTGDVSVNPYQKVKSNTYGQAIKSLGGQPCTPAPAPPKVEAKEPGFWDWLTSSSPEPPPPPRDGKITIVPNNDAVLRARAAASF